MIEANSSVSMMRCLASRRVIHAGRGVRIFLTKRFLRIFLPYWPIALVLGA